MNEGVKLHNALSKASSFKKSEYFSVFITIGEKLDILN